MPGESAMSEWKTVIGLEVHAELETASKMFSPCPVVDSVEADPNSAVDPLSLGMPGTLPVINMQAMEYGIMVGLALNCEIPPINQFARKNYFYPDLPKGYQISQYDRPLAINGRVRIQRSDTTDKWVGIRRAHMEEDTGKLTHTLGGSLVDYNRAGVPLLEIVSEPELHSLFEVGQFARKLRSILRYLGVNSGDMSKGVLRFEANVSIMREEEEELRERTEIKNLNSIRNMISAISYEIARQQEVYDKGDTVRPATMGWDESAQKTYVQRYKERADEYRYFPEPDLPVVEVSRVCVDSIKAKIPDLPDQLIPRFINELGIDRYDAESLTTERDVAMYFEKLVGLGVEPKIGANWILQDLGRLMNQHQVPREEFSASVPPVRNFAELLALVQEGVINQSTARKTVLPAMWETGKDARAIVDEGGLAQVSDTSLIADAVDKVLRANDDMVQRYLDGNDKVMNAIFGRIMGELRGKGDPKVVRELLSAKLLSLRD